jgi:hypothetical protein
VEEYCDRLNAALKISVNPTKKGAHASNTPEDRAIFKSYLLGAGPRISIVPRPPEGKVEQNGQKWGLTPFQVTVKNPPNDRQVSIHVQQEMMTTYYSQTDLTN